MTMTMISIPSIWDCSQRICNRQTVATSTDTIVELSANVVKMQGNSVTKQSQRLKMLSVPLLVLDALHASNLFAKLRKFTEIHMSDFIDLVRRAK